MEGFPVEIEILVRFSDCDPMGHVNNAVYFNYLEEARFAWFRAVLGEDAFQKNPIILGEATCTYRAAATPYEKVLVGIRVERIGRASFDHRYRIVAKSDGRLIAEAKTTGVGYDYATSSTRELGPDFRAAVERSQGPLPA